MNWCDDWGTISPAGGNGSSGRVVVNEVLAPLGVPAEQTYFTDCLPYYFVKSGTGSQGQRISAVYPPFAFATIFARLPQTHPGNRTPAWRTRHTQWTTAASS